MRLITTLFLLIILSSCDNLAYECLAAAETKKDLINCTRLVHDFAPIAINYVMNADSNALQDLWGILFPTMETRAGFISPMPYTSINEDLAKEVLINALQELKELN